MIKIRYTIKQLKDICEVKGYELFNNEYKTLYDPAYFVCSEHKELGKQQTTFYNIITFKKQCKKCKALEVSQRERKKVESRENEFIKKCKDNNWEYQYFLSHNGTNYIYYICNENREKGIQKIRTDHLFNGVKCPYCRGLIVNTQDLLNDKRIKEVEILGEYIACNKKIKCRCLKCNNTFYMTPNHLKRGESCPFCKQSKGEKRIKEILDKNNIKYETQFSFKECKNINSLLFDFYLPYYNLCIEYNGEQHYKPVEYFGGKDEFEIQKKRDNIKRKFCRENHITLLEISYKQFNNIEKIINNTLITVETTGQ